ncbi:hypothetical protein [Ralstonia sp. UNC404CL21Col]|uniref:hypothetical protein n=1 Tax=Ralstonia sp. UNC404CL21Col TaxID=1380362 RepID=UPI00344C2E2B
MGQHAGKQVAHALGLLGTLAHRFCKHLVDSFVESDHLLERRRVRLCKLLPPMQHAGAQGAVFRHHIVDVETVGKTVVGMFVGGFIEAGLRGRPVAPRFGPLLLRASAARACRRQSGREGREPNCAIEIQKGWHGR